MAVQLRSPGVSSVGVDMSAGATDTLRGTANLAVVNLGPPEAEELGRDEADPLDAAGLGPVPDDELVAPMQPMTIRPRRRTPATDKVRISARYRSGVS
jgi:hypothetical protein